jgi:hypothetical protein
MTTTKRLSKKSKKSKVLGLGNKYYNSSSNSVHSVDSLDKRMKTVFKKLDIPNTDNYIETQDKWIAVGITGIIVTLLLGLTAVKGRLN